MRAALPHLIGEERDSSGAVAVLYAVLADSPAALSAWLTVLRAEQLGGGGGSPVLDARPPYLETGLADRAVASTPPKLPSGADVDTVVARIVDGIRDGNRSLTNDLRSGEPTAH